ncbi:MAG: hypothetical protein Q7J27_07380 [Syntrophales bacterium]|nr:hypothetical protein [Syntrophales bacterium]
MNILNEMKIESVKEEKGKVTVITTGAKYVIHKFGENGRIFCYQLINKERLIAVVDFNYSFSTLSLERKDETTCVFQQQLRAGMRDASYLRLQINSDSLLDIYCLGELKLSFSGHFLPDYSAMKDGNILLIDKMGGIGVYPYQGLRNMEKVVDFSYKEWKIYYTLNSYCRFFLSIFPPRRFNYKQSFEDRIAHHGSIAPEALQPFPSNREIEDAAKYTNIMVLHASIWQGNFTRSNRPVKTPEDCYANASCSCFDYLPVNEQELVRVIRKAHSLGMRIIPYMSPFYSTARGKDFLDRVNDVLNKYNFDGVYYDGSSADMLCAYQLIRDTRALLKDKILYFHCTSDPLMSTNIFCPFINTYADYVLRAEHITDFNDTYLRYVISGFNISNTINYVCYFDYPSSFIRKLVDKVLAVNARFYLGMPETGKERLLKKVYFPKLNGLKRKRLKVTGKA